MRAIGCWIEVGTHISAITVNKIGIRVTTSEILLTIDSAFTVMIVFSEPRARS